MLVFAQAGNNSAKSGTVFDILNKGPNGGTHTSLHRVGIHFSVLRIFPPEEDWDLNPVPGGMVYITRKLGKKWGFAKVSSV
jgi:hypothetical protein